jgi:hypothetical protein
LGKNTGRTYPISKARQTLCLEADLDLDKQFGEKILEISFGITI